jgi:hypothetical protein
MESDKNGNRKLPKPQHNLLPKMGVVIQYRSPSPQNIRIIRQLGLTQPVTGYMITGELSGALVNPSGWQQPPHSALANLAEIQGNEETSLDGISMADPRAAKAFLKGYGVLYINGINKATGDQHAAQDSEGKRTFRVNSEDLTEARTLLRRGWEGDPRALQQVRHDAFRGLVIAPPESPSPLRSFELIVANLWSLVCILFWRDYTLRRLSRCVNPDCRAYFVKPRKTQNVCQRQVCLDWSQRQYRLDWWDRRGRRRRATKRAQKKSLDRGDSM